MQHLPMSQDAFDNLLTAVFRHGTPVASLSDDELLTLALMGDTVAASPKGASLADQVDGWATVMAAVDAALATR